MQIVDATKNKCGYKLTQKTKQFAWSNFGNYSYTDWDEATKERDGKTRREIRIEIGRPRQDITFYKKPKNRKKDVIVRMVFDDNGEYAYASTHSCGVSKRELQTWVDESFSWLEENGYAEKIEERRNK